MFSVISKNLILFYYQTNLKKSGKPKVTLKRTLFMQIIHLFIQKKNGLAKNYIKATYSQCMVIQYTHNGSELYIHGARTFFCFAVPGFSSNNYLAPTQVESKLLNQFEIIKQLSLHHLVPFVSTILRSEPCGFTYLIQLQQL